jgi:sugar lactone lactonase YvrE
MRALLPLLFLAACAPESVEPDPPDEVDPCADSDVGAMHVLSVGFDGSEGLTFSDDGRLFVGDSDMIAEIQPDGTWAQIATVPASIGLAWWGDRLMVASSDGGANPDADGVWSVDVDTGDVELFANIEGANFLTVSPWGSLIVSDPNVDRLLELDADGVSTTWLDGQISPNGTAFTEDGSALWVATTYADVQPVWRVPVDDGAAGSRESVAEFGAGDVGDGIALGASGAVYVAQNIGGRIDRVDPDGTVTTVSEQAAWAASLAFGEGEGWDACSVYVTSLFSEEIFRIEVGEVGLPPLR